MDKLLDSLRAHGQEHLLKFYDDISDEQKASLKVEIESIDWEAFGKIYTEQVLPQTDGGSGIKPTSKIADDLLEELPADSIDGADCCSKESLERYRTIGMTCISQGKVAALLLAGGQGTRLGVSYPKGMFDVGLPSHKSLFQLQAEQLLKLAETIKSQKGQNIQVFWYIMTSEATMDMTREFFERCNYFGLDKNHVIFFEQLSLPCLGFNGKVLLDEKYKIARSPDGNGGLYEVLHKKGIINHMRANGVEYVHAYCVDNVMVRVCDPTYMGFGISKKLDAGAKFVEKVSPNESVGVICKFKDRIKVIEYSELSDSNAHKRNEATGKLVFNTGNICDQFFSVDFLDSMSGDLQYHLAVKKIPSICLETGTRIVPDQPNGIKLEKFIFDSFEYAHRFGAWRVTREEFCPLKGVSDISRALEALMSLA